MKPAEELADKAKAIAATRNGEEKGKGEAAIAYKSLEASAAQRRKPQALS